MNEHTKRALDIAIELAARLCALLALGYYAVIAVMQAMRSHDAMTLLQLCDQSLNVLFVLIARFPRAIDRRPPVVILAVVTTFANILIAYGGGHALVPRPVTYSLQVAGIAVELVAKLSLGRSFGLVPANRGVKTGGAYRLVRHPMYLGYMIALLGVLLGSASWANLAVIAGVYVLQGTRAWLEERVLSRDEAYRAYQEKVRWRVVPFVF